MNRDRFINDNHLQNAFSKNIPFLSEKILAEKIFYNNISVMVNDSIGKFN